MLEKLKSPIAALVTLVVFLALLAFIAYRYNQFLDYPWGDYSNATVQEGSSPLKGAITVAEEDTVSAPQEKSGVRVAVRVVYTAVGLNILEDGESVYNQVSEPSFSEEFEAEEAITIIAADGGAVQVEVNGGDPEPLGTSGEPVTRTFTADSEG